MAPGTYDIQAVRVPSGSFNFVLLITFRHPLSQIMSAFMVLENVVLALSRVGSQYSRNTFIPVNHSEVTQDRGQAEMRFWWSPATFWL
jgi:hypothetical protein